MYTRESLGVIYIYIYISIYIYICLNWRVEEKALQSLEEKWSSQGQQLAALAERALEKLRVAEEAMEAGSH